MLVLASAASGKSTFAPFCYNNGYCGTDGDNIIAAFKAWPSQQRWWTDDEKAQLYHEKHAHLILNALRSNPDPDIYFNTNIEVFLRIAGLHPKRAGRFMIGDMQTSVAFVIPSMLDTLKRVASRQADVDSGVKKHAFAPTVDEARKARDKYLTAAAYFGIPVYTDFISWASAERRYVDTVGYNTAVNLIDKRPLSQQALDSKVTWTPVGVWASHHTRDFTVEETKVSSHTSFRVIFTNSSSDDKFCVVKLFLPKRGEHDFGGKYSIKFWSGTSIKDTVKHWNMSQQKTPDDYVVSTAMGVLTQELSSRYRYFKVTA